MQFDTELEAAGRRAATRSVPPPPAVATLQTKADKQRTKRRLVGSSVAAVAILAVSVPVTLNLRGSTTVQNVVSGTGELAPAAQVESPAPADESSSATAAMQDEEPDSDRTDSSEEHFTLELRTGGHEQGFSVTVLAGVDAAAAGAEAAAAADETIVVDELTVWVSNDGDQRTVSALVAPDEYVEVTGSAEHLDQLIDVLRTGKPGMHGLSGFAFPHMFDGDSEHPGFGHGNLEEFFEGRFQDGDFGELEDFLKNFEGEIGEFQEFFDANKFGPPFDRLAENFDGCVTVDGDDNGDTFHFEFPPGCATDD